MPLAGACESAGVVIVAASGGCFDRICAPVLPLESAVSTTAALAWWSCAAIRAETRSTYAISEFRLSSA